MNAEHTAPVPSHRSGADGELLRSLRAALRESFPAIPVGGLLQIARRSGATRFPPGFLVAGELADRSRTGPRGLLTRLAKGDESTPVHPLFSAEFYRLANPDLAGASVAAWLHYQVYGRVEERSPHPLIDLKYLGAALEGVAVSDLLDTYLGDSGRWTAEPGPYVDCLRFMLLGEWDHETNPLEQIVSRHLSSHWVHSRLMLVDAGSQSEAVARLAAVGFLLARSGAHTRLAPLLRWTHGSPTHGSPTHDATEHKVIPGFLLTSGATVAASTGTAAVSPDLTAVRLRDETIGIRSGARVRSPRLYWLEGSVGRAALHDLVAGIEGDAVVAPSSAAQETSLRQLRRDLGRDRVTVLALGVQSTVEADELVIVPAEPAEAPPLWNWDSAPDYTSTAIVLAEQHRLRATGDPRLRAALAAGAELCLVAEGRLNSWLPQLQARATVIVDAALVEPVAAFVERARMHTLPPTGRDA